MFQVPQNVILPVHSKKYWVVSTQLWVNIWTNPAVGLNFYIQFLTQSGLVINCITVAFYSIFYVKNYKVFSVYSYLSSLVF